MKKINYNNLDQDIYYFTLKNGFRVYLIPFKDKKNYYAILGTKYGSIDVEFDNNEGHFKTPYGIAHFLEHKIFAEENGEDPFAFFSKSGVNTNASTTFDNTRYYIWGVNEIEKNLNYFLDFILSPYFTDQNVEKEKGIIYEEIKMYDDSPEWVLDDEMRKNLFYNLPVREKIAGSIEEVSKITKEDLYNVYNNFYHPSEMFLVIGGNINPYEIEKLIRNHKKLNSFNSKKEVKHFKVSEPNDVKSEYKELHMDIKVPKIRYSIKISKDNFKDLNDIDISMYLGIMISYLFGQTSEFKEKVTLQSLSSGFFLEKNSYDNFYTIDITAESDKADILIEEINKTLENIKINKKDLERIKKVWIASEIRMIDSVEMTVDNIYSDIISYDKIYDNRIELIRQIDLKNINKFLKKLDLTNRSLVMILPKEEN